MNKLFNISCTEYLPLKIKNFMLKISKKLCTPKMEAEFIEPMERMPLLVSQLTTPTRKQRVYSQQSMFIQKFNPMCEGSLGPEAKNAFVLGKLRTKI